jgi:hypothetical protein
MENTKILQVFQYDKRSFERLRKIPGRHAHAIATTRTSSG